MNTDPPRSRWGAPTNDFPRRQDLELLLPESTLDIVREEVPAEQHQNQETGGIIIGGRANVNRLFVTDLTGPGPNAHHCQTEFSPDIEHAQRRLDAYREDWDVYWLGVWHKHPGQMRSLSQGDVEQMRELVQDPDTLDEVVSIIATLRDDTVHLNGYHMDESLEPHRLPMSIVDDNVPIHKQFLRDHDPEPPFEKRRSPGDGPDVARGESVANVGRMDDTNSEGGDDEDFRNEAEAGEDPTVVHRSTNSDVGFGPGAPSGGLDLAAATQSAVLNAGIRAVGNTRHLDTELTAYDPLQDDVTVPVHQGVLVETSGSQSNQPEEVASARSEQEGAGGFRDWFSVRSLLSLLKPGGR